MTINNNEETLN